MLRKRKGEFFYAKNNKVSFLLITNSAKRLAFRIINPASTQPIYMILAIQCFTVCQIVPIITLFATFIHNGISADGFCQWIQLAVMCFPMALCLQIFLVGPLVRLIFRNIFKNQSIWEKG